jgi:ATP-dependent RNA helicase DDX24/MAK5
MHRICLTQHFSQPCRSKAGAKKKQKGGKAAGKSSSKALWASADGWAHFDAADELLLGAEEGGFAGLEVLEDVRLIDAGEALFREV